MLFSPKTVEQLIRAEFPDIVEYELVVTRKDIMDEITLRIELSPKIAKDDADQLAKKLAERHKILTNLSCKVKVEPEGALPRYDLKAKRFKDLREVH